MYRRPNLSFFLALSLACILAVFLEFKGDWRGDEIPVAVQASPARANSAGTASIRKLPTPTCASSARRHAGKRQGAGQPAAIRWARTRRGDVSRRALPSPRPRLWREGPADPRACSPCIILLCTVMCAHLQGSRSRIRELRRSYLKAGGSGGSGVRFAQLRTVMKIMEPSQRRRVRSRSDYPLSRSAPSMRFLVP